MINKRFVAAVVSLAVILSANVSVVPNFYVSASDSSNSADIKELSIAREKYINDLNEARSISESDYSPSSYTVFQKRIDEYDRSASLNDEYETLTDYEYAKLSEGIKEAYSLLREPSHTYYQEFAELIEYCDSINSEDYTDESYSAYSKKYAKLKKRYALPLADEYVESNNDVGIYQDLIVNRYQTCLNLLVSKNCEEIVKVDDSTGLKLISNSDVISADSTLVVDKFDANNWEWQNVKSTYLSDIETVCSQYEYYSFTLRNEDGSRFEFGNSFTVELPVPEYFDINNLTVSLYKNSCAAGAIGGISIDKENRIVTVNFTSGSWLYSANGAAILLKNPITSVDPLTFENDGVYQIQADLTKYTDAAEASMANAALVNEAYLTKVGNSIDVYLNFDPIYVVSPDTPAFCGGLWCEKGSVKDGNYYSDSEVVYDYYTNSDGTIRDNDIYNGITEIPCVKTIKLHLERDCYNEFGGYTLAVSSPTMAAAFGTKFEDMFMDDLACNLMISQPLYLGTLDQASSYLPTYDITALQREYEYANILADDNIYTDETWAKVQALLDTETTTEDKKCVTGYSDTTELASRIADYKEATAALVVDEDKQIADGRYLVPAHMIKTDRVSDSMSENAINHNVVVDVKDGKATVQVEFKGMAIDDKFGYLEKLSYFNEGYEYNGFGTPVGDVTDAAVINKYDVIDEYSGKNPPHYLEFPLVDGKGAEWVPLQVFVPVMEAVSEGSGTQSVLMHLDWENKVPVGEIAEYEGNTLSLKDDFGFNFFFNFSEQTLNDESAKVQFTLPNGTVTEYIISETADDDKTANGYKFRTDVAAKELTVPVKAQVILSNGEVSDEFTCSVKEYADELLASSNNESEITLVKSILNYGGYAQEYFGTNIDNLANADLTDEEKALGNVKIVSTKREATSDEDDGIDFFGSTLSLNTKVDVKVYFTLSGDASIDDYTFTLGSTELTPVSAGSRYYVEISDISSKEIDVRSTIEVANNSGEGELTVKTGPYAYIYKALNKSTNEKLQNVSKALYFYSQAAENYTA